MDIDGRNEGSTNFDWDRSFSEPDLTDPLKHLNRFAIKHPHEYISVDDLKFYRRRKPPDFHTQSNICLCNQVKPELPVDALKTEYKAEFHNFEPSLRPQLLRRSTSLRLDGLMQHKSEHQEQFNWFSPEDCRRCRASPIRNPENLHVGGYPVYLDPEYRASFISHPMVDHTAKILPRESLRVDPKQVAPTNETHQPTQHPSSSPERKSEETVALKNLTEDKSKRDVAAYEQQKCHLQERNIMDSKGSCLQPTEYQYQFVQFPLGKAHSIPQISHLKMRGDFQGVPEYSDNFKMYDSYSKSTAIRNADNLQQSGSVRASTVFPNEVPEYREKFRDPPSDAAGIDKKSAKAQDHLHPRGEFSKNLPEYSENFRDPQIKQIPEREKGREPFLRLKGKLEFNPEYRSTFLDFPRSRPTVIKSTSSFRLPTTASTSSTATTKIASISKSPKRTPRHKYKSISPSTHYEPVINVTATPEYRRAQYNYQLRERTPPRSIIESVISSTASQPRKGFIGHRVPESTANNVNHKGTTSRPRPTASILNKQQSCSEKIPGAISSKVKAVAKFGRRAIVHQNAKNCRENASINEGNPKYALSMRTDKYNQGNQDSFVVLKEPCKRTNWMKKSWYD